MLAQLSSAQHTHMAMLLAFVSGKKSHNSMISLTNMKRSFSIDSVDLMRCDVAIFIIVVVSARSLACLLICTLHDTILQICFVWYVCVCAVYVVRCLYRHSRVLHVCILQPQQQQQQKMYAVRTICNDFNKQRTHTGREWVSESSVRQKHSVETNKQTNEEKKHSIPPAPPNYAIEIFHINWPNTLKFRLVCSRLS